MSRTALVESSSAVNACTCERSRWFSRCVTLNACAGGVVPDGASRPASRARRHLPIWESYKPSRRSRAPRWPCSVAASYSATIRSLYSLVNVRRAGRSPPAEAMSAEVIVIKSISISRPVNRHTPRSVGVSHPKADRQGMPA